MPYDQGPRFLIRDNDGKFGRAFSAVAEAGGIDPDDSAEVAQSQRGL